MRKLLIAAAMTAISMSAAAQNEIFTHDESDDRVTFGARVSFDITVPGDMKVKDEHASYDMFNPGCGFSFGGVATVPVSGMGNLYFEPGLNFFYHTNKVDKYFIENDDPTLANIKGVSMREFGFEIPVMFGYYFNFNPVKIHIFTGPELAVGLSGKYHTSAKVNNIDMSGSTSMYDANNRVDVAWRLGVGATFSDKYYVAFSAAPGMCNWTKAENATLHRTNVSFTLGYTLPF